MNCKLEEIVDVTMGQSPKSEYYNTEKNGYPFLQGNRTFGFKYPTFDTYTTVMTKFAKAGDVIMSVRAPVGALNITPVDMCLGRGVCSLRMKNGNQSFLFYMMKYYVSHLIKKESGTVFGSVNRNDINGLEVDIPEDVEEQKKIARYLEMIDDKIELNNAINNNLLEQVLAIYRHRFVDTTNELRQTYRADEYFDISIGKTPPRKEPQWFSTNPKDVTWVSISDMGTCGLYISESSEQLTREAVDRHNVKIVPDNTVLLSFKLTVGRIAITDGEMTTNEAIAHFKTDKKEINEYLYCYLKCFNYQTMGSTSSIATAVNSKIIKGMPFIVPTDEEITEFHSLAAPMFAKIKANQAEISNLTALRDTLLPKLMSGELDVSDIDL
ncbi:restriction endonuclease subunit S [Peptoniphilus sp. BV3C26]|uniref:restriction endonuclease subunit S n=1 Tax=Peptoniphilus sp. BV3C26 TaxID=1111134 RepID=UPI0003B8DA98|nr:restriction endonuclease subunit S [Peptoniphilus sp. BV3C26]ERT56270.1 type I restriction modification DNA specificity domain protein [Peptoniphilus sp. BV3C26]